MARQLDAGPAGDRLLDQRQVGGQVVELFAEPLFAPFIGRLGGHEAQQVDVGTDAAHRLLQLEAQTGIGHHCEGAAEPGDVEGLARGHHHRRTLGRRRADGAVGDVAGVLVQQQVAVNFIGADHQVVALGDGVDGQQLLAGEHGAARVLRVAQQQQIRRRRLALQLLDIQYPATGLFHHGHGEQRPVVEARRLQEGVVDRLGGDDAAPVLAPGLAG